MDLCLSYVNEVLSYFLSWVARMCRHLWGRILYWRTEMRSLSRSLNMPPTLQVRNNHIHPGLNFTPQVILEVLLWYLNDYNVNIIKSDLGIMRFTRWICDIVAVVHSLALLASSTVYRHSSKPCWILHHPIHGRPGWHAGWKWRLCSWEFFCWQER